MIYFIIFRELNFEITEYIRAILSDVLINIGVGLIYWWRSFELFKLIAVVFSCFLKLVTIEIN